jgi:uncharacterized zinc-type alcohol dehydrogenase-like protein
MTAARGYAATNPKSPLGPFAFERRAPREHDVDIEVLFCGICHSDVHQVRDEWSGSTYPMVPGHEVLGRVTHVGPKVTKLKVGDLAGVGCMVDSCSECVYCKAGEEQHCQKGVSWTYNSKERDGSPTYGGYSDHLVVDEKFALRVTAQPDLARVAPLLCAGITTYSPLKRAHVGPGQRVGIIGLGGLGHVGVRLARSFGAEVVVFTSSPGKSEDARRLGAGEVVVSRDARAMAAQAGRFDFILDTVSAPHDLNVYLDALKPHGSLVLVGLPSEPPTVIPGKLVSQSRHLSGSVIGGIAETQEMLDYCAQHEIFCDVEVIPVQKVNEAYDRLVAGDVKYRFVLDLASLG